MRRVKKIGDIELDYPLFIKEEFNTIQAKAVTAPTLGGSIVVFESYKRGNANYITLISKESGWIKEETLKKVLTLLDDLDVEVDLTLDDDSTIKVRPALEKGEIIKWYDVVNENGGWFKVEINLCRI